MLECLDDVEIIEDILSTKINKKFKKLKNTPQISTLWDIILYSYPNLTTDEMWEDWWEDAYPNYDEILSCYHCINSREGLEEYVNNPTDIIRVFDLFRKYVSDSDSDIDKYEDYTIKKYCNKDIYDKYKKHMLD